MEEQSEPHTPRNSAAPEATPANLSNEQPSSRSVPSLRFPRPQGNQRLANWVSSSSPDIMSTPDDQDELALSESGYEIISIESGSQDGRTDSTSESFDHDLSPPHPEEVQGYYGLDDPGFANTFAFTSDPGDEESDGTSSNASIRYADEVLASPSAHAPRPAAFPLDFPAIPANPPLQTSHIEFKEPDDCVYLDKISVKHTVKEFSEVETVEIAQHMKVANPPSRLCATIRQTMSQQCLSAPVAFRLVYVGNEAAKWEIVNKISRSITCSPSLEGTQDRFLRRNTDGVYNIVPITDLGYPASGDGDVELMQSSGYQIKVETCLSAKEIPIEGGSFPRDTVYSLTIDDGNGGKTYKSVLGPGGAQVQPSWSIPHVVVFYCSDDDDVNMRTTQDNTWEFCNRHGVPCIFVSENPTFLQPLSQRWQSRVNEHSVHLSLESRDPGHPIPDRRLPIDVTSFLNIDNRQMNKNLAFLTGLQEPPSATEKRSEAGKALSSGAQDAAIQESETASLSSIRRYITHNGLDYLGKFVAIAMVLVFAGDIALLIKDLASTRAAHLGSHVVSSPTSSFVSTATSTVTVSLTSTKTISIGSLDTILPAGLLLDGQTAASEAPPKDTLCSVELYSGNEILVKLPSGTKMTWLAKDAIDIDVSRGSDLIKSRLLSIDEGILIEINQKDAHGVLNVSVVTTRKPKINETFAVDFSRDMVTVAIDAVRVAIQNSARMLTSHADEVGRAVGENYAPTLAAMAQKLKSDAATFSESLKEASKVAGKAAQDYSSRISEQSEQAIHRIKGSLQSDGIVSLVDGIKSAVTQRFREAEDLRENLREDAGLSILKAQINSKLWWLRMRGQMAEYENYIRQAGPYLKNQHDVICRARSSRSTSRRLCKEKKTHLQQQGRKDKGLGRRWGSLRG